MVLRRQHARGEDVQLCPHPSRYGTAVGGALADDVVAVEELEDVGRTALPAGVSRDLDQDVPTLRWAQRTPVGREGDVVPLGQVDRGAGAGVGVFVVGIASLQQVFGIL